MRESAFSQSNLNLVSFPLRKKNAENGEKKKLLKRSSMLVGKGALRFSLNKRSKGNLLLGFLRTCCKMGEKDEELSEDSSLMK